VSSLVPLLLLVFQAGKSPVSTEAERARFEAALRERGLYVSAEFPNGCLSWKGVPKRDSVVFHPVLSSDTRCQGIAPVQETWIVRKGEEPLLIAGLGRVPLRMVMFGKHSGRPSDGLLGEAVDGSQPNMLDVILAGGGGSRGGKKSPSWAEKTPTEEVGRSVARAKLDPPKPSDLALSGDAQSRSSESILKVIRSHVGGFRYAYAKHLKRDPTLGGKLSLRFTIAPQGDVGTVATVASTTGSSALDEEIQGKAGRMRFEAIEQGTVTVTYDMLLKRK
jgi:hypothetical protein